MDTVEQLIEALDNAAFAAYKSSHQAEARGWAFQATDIFENDLSEAVRTLSSEERNDALNRATQHVARAWSNAASKPFTK